MNEMLHLKQCTREEYLSLPEWISDKRALIQWAGSGFVHPLDETQLSQYVDSQSRSDTTRMLTAILTATGKPCGHIELKNINPRAGFARLAYVILGPSFRGKGMGKQLVCLALRVGFDEIGLHRIDLGVFDVNLPAIKCYLSAGFVKEGISREAAKVENSYWNMVQMAILEQEWQALKKGSTI